jgi:hypothetical protein
MILFPPPNYLRHTRRLCVLHFLCLERIIERLNFHNVKLSINKSEFAKNKILFLGWIVSHDFLIPDPRRMEKLKTQNLQSQKKEI